MKEALFQPGELLPAAELFSAFGTSETYEMLREYAVAVAPHWRNRYELQKGYEAALARWLTHFALTPLVPKGTQLLDSTATAIYYKNILGDSVKLVQNPQDPFRYCLVEKTRRKEIIYRPPSGILVDEQTTQVKAIIYDSLAAKVSKVGDFTFMRDTFPAAFSEASIVFAIPTHPNQHVVNSINGEAGIQVLQLPFDKDLRSGFVDSLVQATEF